MCEATKVQTKESGRNDRVHVPSKIFDMKILNSDG